MNSAPSLLFARRRAQLQVTAPEWQRKLAYGVPEIGWRGDRYLQLYHSVLEDKIEIWVELPDRKPTLVMKVDAEGFDIYRACAALRDADQRAHSVDDVLLRVDKHNEGVELARAKAHAAQREAADERLRWAVRVDTGNHVRPLTVPRSL